MRRKQMSAAEASWRKWYSDERWERRADYLLKFFTSPAALLPRRPPSDDRSGSSGERR